MDNREKMLRKVAQVARAAAISGRGWKSWMGFYQPELPERLKQLDGKKKDK